MPGDPDHTITSEDALRRHIPAPHAKTPLKKLSALDVHCRAFLGLARLAAAVTRRPDGGAELSIHGGDAGFARVSDERTLQLPVGPGETSALANVRAHGFAGLLFLVPGINETLRVNGRARVMAGDAGSEAIALSVEEAFLHCPKAFLRSQLWDPAAKAMPAPSGDAPAGAWIARSPFWFLGTCQADGHADVSPRGDPIGAVHIEADGTLLVPDRPGNRLLDNYRNVLAHPSAGLLFLVPGSAHALRVTGRARLVDDPKRLAPLRVQGKQPPLALALTVVEQRVERWDALERSGLWDAARYVPRDSLPSMGRMIIDQLQPDRPLLNPVVGGILQRVFRFVEKRTLY